MADTQTAEETLRTLERWMTHHLETHIEHRQPKGGYTVTGTEGWAVCAIPDWDARQKLALIREALSPAPPVAVPAPTESSGATELPELDAVSFEIGNEHREAARLRFPFVEPDSLAEDIAARLEAVIERLDDYKAKYEAAQRDSSDYERIIAECHVLLDQAGVAQDTGAVCNDPTCTSKLGHRLRTLIAASSSRGSEVAR